MDDTKLYDADKQECSAVPDGSSVGLVHAEPLPFCTARAGALLSFSISIAEAGE